MNARRLIYVPYVNACMTISAVAAWVTPRYEVIDYVVIIVVVLQLDENHVTTPLLP